MKPFGTTTDGRDVHAITLSSHGLAVKILTLGAILNDVRLDGVDHTLTVGSDRLCDYEGAMKYHGSIVGPVANRLSDGRAMIDGQTYHFDKNQLGKHTLHGGSHGTHSRVWDVVGQDATSVQLCLSLRDKDGGFPANRTITAHFKILPGPALRLTITTTADAPSIANLTNHSYWNLDGSDHMRDHSLQINAASYLPTDTEAVVTGNIADTANTAFDFSVLRSLTLGEAPLDNTFCLAPDRRALSEGLHLRGGSGLSMHVATTEAGLHVYDDRPTYACIAIEAQGWPDAPNKSGFPSINVTPQSPAVQITEWRFSR